MTGDEPTVLLPNLHQEEPTVQIPEIPQQPVRRQEQPRQHFQVQLPDNVAGDYEEAPRTKAGGPKSRGMSPSLIVGIVAAALVLALVIGVFAYGMILKNGDTIYPNVYVAGINVGEMTRQEAIDAVADAMAASYSSSTLNVQLPDRTLSFHPEQTNVALDADEAIDEALRYGRDGSAISAVTSYFSCKSTEHYIDLQTILELDTAYIREMIDQVAAEVRTEPKASSVSYDEATGVLTVDVGYPDRKLDADGLYEVVYNAFMNGDFTTLVWAYDETPCEPVDLTPYYENYATEVEDAYYDEETHTIVEEVPGYGFDLEEAGQKLAAAADGSQVVIRFEEIEPEMTKEKVEEEMFGEVLYSYSSPYVNNSNHTTNLRLACEAIDGTILNPDEVFSFNDIVGERTAAKGYLPATVYSGGNSVEEEGGGVCQVASTIYYCTLHLDLEQVHREPHQFVVTYVPYGMDATIYWGQIDYKFRNTLTNPIKIEASVEPDGVLITFRGVKETDNYVEMSYTILETYPWQEVEEVDETKEPGYREEAVTPYTGYKVVTYKTIYDADGNQISKEQEAVSVYSKRDKKIIVGPEEVEDPWDDPFDPFEPVDPEDPEDPGDGSGDPMNPWP